MRLTPRERLLVEAVRSAGRRPARLVTRAHVLAALDDGVPVAAIAAVLGVDRTTVWRLRRAWHNGGAEAVLAGEGGPGRPPRFGAHVAQWVRRRAERMGRAGTRPSLSQLRDAARRRWRLDSLSRETVRRWLSSAADVAGYEPPGPTVSGRRPPV